jgi:hypothetical protein
MGNHRIVSRVHANMRIAGLAPPIINLIDPPSAPPSPALRSRSPAPSLILPQSPAAPPSLAAPAQRTPPRLFEVRLPAYMRSPDGLGVIDDNGQHLPEERLDTGTHIQQPRVEIDLTLDSDDEEQPAASFASDD